jgi:hypothetical protein
VRFYLNRKKVGYGGVPVIPVIGRNIDRRIAVQAHQQKERLCPK